MNKDITIDARSERMLELLSQGVSNREIAQRLGYQEGTIRVYLHNLYRKLGVANKTEAVVWYLRRDAPKAAAAPGGNGQAAHAPTDDLLGDMALQEDLHTALGAMGAFVGPHSRVWEIGLRLKGGAADPQARFRQERSRLLWRALLKGDWSYGKRNYDVDAGAGLLVDSPSDGVVLAAILTIGGYTGAADRLVARLTHKRRGGQSASPREAALLRALRRAVDGNSLDALMDLHEVANEKSAPAVVKQLAMALLYHAYVMRGDAERARGTANALWTEAESARQQLAAMGERSLGAVRHVPSPAKPVARKAGVKEKEKAVAR
ncbi:MAG TPA: LuxR C-terminal-related transcriptional regulator [Usitatibacter sp.]|nr:LuxR C-terminal-related transcriptional regulator [Usitatibacter sp.]